ncbi:MAG TPA: glycosyltransferase [Gammaproteobacteria bacterium]|nr:glycosyltransferase [Gammaproteobacteria bacterium]
MLILAALSLLLWILLWLAPWQPWRCRERLEPEPGAVPLHPDFSVLIPARNEADTIGRALAALRDTAPDAQVILIDDESSDATAELARAAGLRNLTLVPGSPPPAGWTGKLWALEQGLAEVRTARVLLLDADIELAPGMLAALQRKADEGYALVSVLAAPRFEGAAARWLLPAFVYFFKLLYPFALANRRGSRVAAAAGGVILINRQVLLDAGGFTAWRDAIIDDCTLAAHVKRAGQRCYLGLTHGARSLRQQDLAGIVGMIARSAYVQLHESPWLLLGTTAGMLLVFWVPPAGLAFAGVTRWLGLAALLLMLFSYLPTLLYYRRNPLAAVGLPLTATVFLAATWYSALRAWLGTRSVWKQRRYPRRAN